MKTTTGFILIIFSVIAISCATHKNSDMAKLYNSTWELEYISGPRIAFNGLYPEKKPTINFDKVTTKVVGNNSCNGYSADYILSKNSISFGEPGPTTMMFCGKGEKVFLDMMKKINKYSFDKNGKLTLLVDEVPMMRFKKID